MQTAEENPVRGLENYTKWPVTPATLDFIFADAVRGYIYRPPEEHDVHVDSWEDPTKPGKLMASSQISGHWTGSIETCLAELDYMAHKIPGYHVELLQDSSNPGPQSFHCYVGGTVGVLAKHAEPTFQLAILKCAIELALFHKLK